MDYWIAFKNGEYISDIDEFGSPIHTRNEEEALKMYNFALAARLYLPYGYALLKR